MLDKLNKDTVLYQEQIVYDIEKKLGNDFVYINENGNLAVDRKVLNAFKKNEK